VITELNDLVSKSVTLSLIEDDDNSNIEMYFAPESKFAAIYPDYVSGNSGYFTILGDGLGNIYNAEILIASEGITQQERSHLIREELTQALGIFKDAWLYPESIFYQGWTYTTEYAPIDRSVISLLYDSRLRSGMTKSQVRNVLGDS